MRTELNFELKKVLFLFFYSHACHCGNPWDWWVIIYKCLISSWALISLSAYPFYPWFSSNKKVDDRFQSQGKQLLAEHYPSKAAIRHTWACANNLTAQRANAHTAARYASSLFSDSPHHGRDTVPGTGSGYQWQLQTCDPCRIWINPRPDSIFIQHKHPIVEGTL